MYGRLILLGLAVGIPTAILLIHFARLGVANLPFPF